MWPGRSRRQTISPAVETPDPVGEAAAEWRAALAGDASPSMRAAWSRWMEADPSHARAYDALVALEDELFAHREDPGLLAVRHETLARASLGRTRRQAGRRRFEVAAALAAAVVLTVGPAALWLGLRAPQPAAERSLSYATAVGQRMNLTLQDGSQVTLNTASRLRVAYSGDQRLIHLDAGQAWFDVAHDAERPFSVVAGDRVVTAHGTRFDVRLDVSSLQVLLAEGSVSVAPVRGGAGAASARLRPSDLLTADAAGVRVRRVADTSQLESWREGLVIFDDTPLSQAAAEINRYAARPLVLEDERVGRVRISGVYRVGGETAFAEALGRGFPIAVDPSDPDRLTLSSRRS